ARLVGTAPGGGEGEAPRPRGAPSGRRQGGAPEPPPSVADFDERLARDERRVLEDLLGPEADAAERRPGPDRLRLIGAVDAEAGVGLVPELDEVAAERVVGMPVGDHPP